MVVLGGGAVCYERGTPVSARSSPAGLPLTLAFVPYPLAFSLEPPRSKGFQRPEG